jgi:hypothetical protein
MRSTSAREIKWSVVSEGVVSLSINLQFNAYQPDIKTIVNDKGDSPIFVSTKIGTVPLIPKPSDRFGV